MPSTFGESESFKGERRGYLILNRWFKDYNYLYTDAEVRLRIVVFIGLVLV